MPAGVVNVMTGAGETGAALVRHSGIAKVSFTGSPEVGAEIARHAGGAFRKDTLELGGKSPQMILPDADLEALLPVAAASLFANQGEICAAATRVLVHESIRDDVVVGLTEQARAVTWAIRSPPARRWAPSSPWAARSRALLHPDRT